MTTNRSPNRKKNKRIQYAGWSLLIIVSSSGIALLLDRFDGMTFIVVGIVYGIVMFSRMERREGRKSINLNNTSNSNAVDQFHVHQRNGRR